MAYGAALYGALLRLLRFVFSGFDFEIFLQAGACRRSLQPTAFSFTKSIHPLCVFVNIFIYNSFIYLVLIVLSLLCLTSTVAAYL